METFMWEASSTRTMRLPEGARLARGRVGDRWQVAGVATAGEAGD
jgi:hypothetical protein